MLEVILFGALFVFLVFYSYNYYINKPTNPQTPPDNYKPPVDKFYPYLKCEEINIATKKTRKEYKNFVVIDFETTGLSPTYDKIVEVGSVKVQNGIITDRFSSLVNPEIDIPFETIKIHGITNKMVKHSPKIYEVLPELITFIGEYPIVAYSIDFDVSFLLINAYDCGYKINNSVIDALSLSRKLYPDLHNHKLETVVKHLGIYTDQAHRALSDASATAEILIKSIKALDIKDLHKAQERASAKAFIK